MQPGFRPSEGRSGRVRGPRTLVRARGPESCGKRKAIVLNHRWTRPRRPSLFPSRQDTAGVAPPPPRDRTAVAPHPRRPYPPPAATRHAAKDRPRVPPCAAGSPAQPATAARASRANPPADCWRSSGAFSSARASTGSSAAGSRGSIDETAGGGLVDVGPHALEVVAADERHRAGQRVEEDAAERVDVGARVEVADLRLLGRHVVDRAERHARAGQRGVRGLGPLLQMPKSVRNACSTPSRDGDEDVRGLHVAVDEAARVRGVERARDLREQRDGALRLEPPLAGDERLEVRAVDVAHRHVQPPALLARAEDLDDVRVVDRPRRGGTRARSARGTPGRGRTSAR